MEVPEDMDDFEARVATMNQQLQEATQSLGLYMRNSYMQPETPESSSVVVYVEFTLGDLAFSDRVQHPEKVKQDDEARQLMAEAGMDNTDAEIVRERWEQWKKREHLKGGGDDDADGRGTRGDDQGEL